MGGWATASCHVFWQESKGRDGISLAEERASEAERGMGPGEREGGCGERGALFQHTVGLSLPDELSLPTID